MSTAHAIAAYRSARSIGAANVTARGYSVTSAAEGDATRLSYNARDFRPNGDLVIDYALPAGEREVSFWTYAGSEATTAPPDRSRERDDEVADERVLYEALPGLYHYDPRRLAPEVVARALGGDGEEDAP